MGTPACRVIWPLHRRHYLTIEEPIVTTPGLPPEEALPPGRDLAARSLLAASCSQARTGTLLGVSRHAIRRIVDFDVPAALRDPAALTFARTSLADTERHGSTLKERDAAMAWLEEQAHHPEPLVEDVSPPVSARVNGSGVTPAVSREPRRQVRLRGSGRATTATRRGPRAPVSVLNALNTDQVQALTHQQQRILSRSMLVACALKAETPDRAVLDGALVDLLADITEAARSIGVILAGRLRVSKVDESRRA